MRSKIGEVYTYNTEDEMLKVANHLESWGFKVQRIHDETVNRFRVKVIGYR